MRPEEMREMSGDAALEQVHKGDRGLTSCVDRIDAEQDSPFDS